MVWNIKTRLFIYIEYSHRIALHKNCQKQYFHKKPRRDSQRHITNHLRSHSFRAAMEISLKIQPNITNVDTNKSLVLIPTMITENTKGRVFWTFHCLLIIDISIISNTYSSYCTRKQGPQFVILININYIIWKTALFLSVHWIIFRAYIVYFHFMDYYICVFILNVI